MYGHVSDFFGAFVYLFSIISILFRIIPLLVYIGSSSRAYGVFPAALLNYNFFLNFLLSLCSLNCSYRVLYISTEYSILKYSSISCRSIADSRDL